MIDLATDSSRGGSGTAIYLDYGLDAHHCARGDIYISERGMRFTSRWKFTIGTQLAISLTHMDPQRGLQRIQLEGTVVWCEPKGGRCYENTLLFLELPDALRPSLREFSHQLTPA
jgi:PilZ domain